MGAGGNTNGSKWIRPEKRARIYQRDGYHCLWCTRDLRFVAPVERTLDHVLCRARGGSNEAHNLITACLTCNAGRADASAIDYAYRIAGHRLGSTDRPLRLVARRAAVILTRILDAVCTDLPPRVV